MWWKTNVAATAQALYSSSSTEEKSPCDARTRGRPYSDSCEEFTEEPDFHGSEESVSNGDMQVDSDTQCTPERLKVD